MTEKRSGDKSLLYKNFYNSFQQKIWKFHQLQKKRIPTNTGGASSPPSSFQNFTFLKKISALPFGTSPRSAFM